jgi:hypothetical protein
VGEENFGENIGPASVNYAAVKVPVRLPQSPLQTVDGQVDGNAFPSTNLAEVSSLPGCLRLFARLSRPEDLSVPKHDLADTILRPRLSEPNFWSVEFHRGLAIFRGPTQSYPRSFPPN